MNAVLVLFALRLRLLRNRLRVGSRAGRLGMTALRVCAYLMGYAFLRFGAAVIAETARDANARWGAGDFFFGSSLITAFAIIFVVNLLVFASEEFDTTDSTRDTAFLLSLPLTLRQVVWAKSLLRSTVDVYGVFLLVPLLWALVIVHGATAAHVAIAVGLFFSIELVAILLAMAIFVWTARVVPYHRLEALRLALGMVLPTLASAAIAFLRESVRTGALDGWARAWGPAVAATPLGHAVSALSDPAGAVHHSLCAFGVFALAALACDLAIAWPSQALARLQEGFGRTTVAGSATALFARFRSPLALMVAKDVVLLYRRPVFLLTTVLFPIAITGIDLLSLVLRSRQGIEAQVVEYLLNASVYVTLLILPFLGAAQSFGQTEHGRIGLLQALPLSMSSVMRAKVLLFAPLTVGAALAIQLVGDVAFHRFEPVATTAKLAWTAVAATLATHVAVCAAALFPIFEFGVLAVRGANMAIGGMLHFTVTSAVGLLVFPLYSRNKLIVLALTLPLVTYLWRQGANRLAHYDEGSTLTRTRTLEWDEAYVLFGLYAALQVVVYVALLFVWDVSKDRVLVWSMDFAALSLIGLTVATAYYLMEKGPPARAPLGLGRSQLWKGAAAGLGGGFALAFLLTAIMKFIGGGDGAIGAMLLATDSRHLALVIAVTAVTIAPFTEEMFFRGLLYGSARRAFGRAFATPLVALLFALMHPDRTMLAMVGLGLFQILLFELTGTLYAPIAAHTAFNAASLVAFALARGAPAGLPLPAYLALVGGVLPALTAWLCIRTATLAGEPLAREAGPVELQ